MRSAEVLVLAISGRSNKIHEYGQTVTENQFIAGRFDELVAGGYLKVIAETEEPAIPVESDAVTITFPEQPEQKEQGVIEAEERAKAEKNIEGEGEQQGETKTDAEAESKGEVDDTEDAKTRGEIMVKLTEMKIPFNKNMSKNELYELWRDAKSKSK